MSNKAIISCAITGAMHTPTMSAALPITPAQIAEQSIAAAHEAFLRSRGLVNQGTRLGLGRRRVTHCYNCKRHLDNAFDVACAACGWIICACGACGCGYASPG